MKLISRRLPGAAVVVASLLLAACGGGGGSGSGTAPQFTDKGAVTVGGAAVTGNAILQNNIYDQYSFSVTSGNVYTVSVTAPALTYVKARLVFKGTYAAIAAEAGTSFDTSPGSIVFTAHTTGTYYVWVVGNYSLSVAQAGAKATFPVSLNGATMPLSVINGQPATISLNTTTGVTGATISSLSSTNNILAGAGVGFLNTAAQQRELAWGSATLTSGNTSHSVFLETNGDVSLPQTDVKLAYIQLNGTGGPVTYSLDDSVGSNYHRVIAIAGVAGTASQYWEYTTIAPPQALTLNTGAAALACAPTLTVNPSFTPNPIVGFGQVVNVSLSPSAAVNATVDTYFRYPGTVASGGPTPVPSSGGVVSIPGTVANNTKTAIQEYAEITLSIVGGCSAGYYAYDRRVSGMAAPRVANYLVWQRDPVARTNYFFGSSVPVATLTINSQ